jgi:hypothetical protein
MRHGAARFSSYSRANASKKMTLATAALVRIDNLLDLSQDFAARFSRN